MPLYLPIFLLIDSFSTRLEAYLFISFMGGFMDDYEERILQLGIKLPVIPPPAGAYVPAVKSGNLVYCSGQGPYRDGNFAYIGKVGTELSLEDGYNAARIAALNCLSGVRSVTESLNKVVRIVQVRGFVNCAADFYEHPKVVNGASDLLLGIFGEAGKHARCSVGASTLPMNIPVEIEMVVEVK